MTLQDLGTYSGRGFFPLMSPNRYFSLDEANRAVAQVAPLLLQSQDLQTRAIRTKERLDRLWQRLERGEPVLDDIASLQQQLDHTTREFTSVLARLEAIGCILRDLEVGLVDFPARVDDTELYLCWRLGEEGIQYWHGMDEGYAGRKPITTMPGTRIH